MSRKMVVAAVTAAGVVGFGSAAVATVDPAGLGGVTDKLPSASQAKDSLGQGVESQDVTLPMPSHPLAGAIEELRSKADSGNVSLQHAQMSGDRLATALDSLAAHIRGGSERLGLAPEQGADKVATQLESSADKVRGMSAQERGGSAAVSGGTATEQGSGAVSGGGGVSTQEKSGSVHGSGAVSSEHATGSFAGGDSVSQQQALQQLQTTLAHVRQLDQQDALGGASDLLDSGSAQEQLQHVAAEVHGLVS